MNKLKKFLTLKNKITLRLLSVFVAVLLWSIVMRNENPIFTRKFTQVPIEVRYENYINEQNLSVIKNEELMSDIRVEGRRNIIGEISQDDIKLYVDMREYQKNQDKFIIHYTLPSGIVMNRMSKDRVKLTLGELSEKKLPINIHQTGVIPVNNMLIDKMDIDTDLITISGEKEKVAKVVSANVDLDLGTLTESSKRELDVYLLDKDGNEVEGLRTSSKYILADIRLSSFKEVPIELVTTDELPKNITVRNMILSNRHCVLVGAKEDLDKIETVKTQKISLNHITGNMTIPLELHLPERVKLKDHEEFSVSFELEGNIEKTYSLTNKNIQFLNDEGLEVTVLRENEFKVRVSGLQADLDALKEEDIHLVIDLKDAQRTEGFYPVSIDPIDGIIVKQLTPRVIELQIK